MRFVNGNIYNRINTSIRFVSFLVAVCLPPKMNQKRVFYTGCVFRTDNLDRVGFEHQVGTYPYEND